MNYTIAHIDKKDHSILRIAGDNNTIELGYNNDSIVFLSYTISDSNLIKPLELLQKLIK